MKHHHIQLKEKIFGRDQKPKYHVFSPLRVCPLGAHIDHQHGKVTGFAIDQGVDLFISATQNGEIQLVSNDFEEVVSFKVGEVINGKQNNWGDYVRGVVISLRRDYLLEKGIKGVVIGSEIPVGGLSTSAALLCGLVSALIKFQIVRYTSYAERQYVGLRNGILDQSCVMLCKQNKLLYLDTKSSQYSIIPFEQSQLVLPFQIGIFFSGVTRKLTQTNFNIRVDQCKTAAWMLQSFAGKQLKSLESTRLRDVQRVLYDRHVQKLPQNFRKRATHFFSQLNRAQKGVQIWKSGNLKQFGRLIFQSCQSSIYNYQCGSPELIAIYKIMKQTDGIYGGRFSGAGFKGACFCLIDPLKKQHIKRQVTQSYLKQFPQYQTLFKVFFCKTTNGSKIVQIQQ